MSVTPGVRYSWLICIRVVGEKKAIFRCACGTEREMFSHPVEKGVTKSCGCKRRANIQRRYKRNVTVIDNPLDRLP